jgi:hypothetical protein
MHTFLEFKQTLNQIDCLERLLAVKDAHLLLDAHLIGVDVEGVDLVAVGVDAYEPFLFATLILDNDILLKIH